MFTKLSSLILIISITLLSCNTNNVKNIKDKLSYKNFIQKFKKKKTEEKSDTTNIFDDTNFDPAIDSVNDILNTIETVYQSDSSLIGKMGKDSLGVFTHDILVNNNNDSFTNDIKKITPEEIAVLKENLKSFKNDSSNILPVVKTKKECIIWADVSKNDQRLYLYVNGEVVDTFKISSGGKGHDTPNFDKRPSGPIFTKYTSKKYPGGNYNGLGNMPYVVFVQGGYALHGTTLGNIKKLGTPASHGCIRMHPDNAKIFNSLVKEAGIENTWVTIRD